MDVGLTQRELAERVGCSVVVIGQWERGRAWPLARRWPTLRAVLGQDLGPVGQDFASRLRAARLRAGLTQDELARRAGLHSRSIRNSERRLYCPREVTVRKLERVLGEGL